MVNTVHCFKTRHKYYDYAPHTHLRTHVRTFVRTQIVICQNILTIQNYLLIIAVIINK